jgi:hypothetical protein
MHGNEAPVGHDQYATHSFSKMTQARLSHARDLIDVDLDLVTIGRMQPDQ